ncbi:MAG TPA: BMP family ABC transporter substrate-binding protein [Bacillota bacterium]|jgi:basic membrane protein A
MRTRKLLALILVASLALTIVLAAGCKKALEPPKRPDVRIGLVFDVGGRGDKSFNDSAFAGFERAIKEFDPAAKQDGTTWTGKYEWKYLEPSAGGENREQLLRTLAEDKYTLEIGVGFLFTDALSAVAKNFPGTKFGLVDGFVDKLDDKSNIVCLGFKEHEGSFLVGAAAAKLSKTGIIGFVGGMKMPLIEKFEAGYYAGAKYVNPKINVLSAYIGTTGDAFKDPTKGKELALGQYQKKADVVYHASGASGMGVFQAAAAQKKLAIGVDSDQYLSVSADLQPYVVTSMIKRVDVSVYETVKAVINNAYKGGYATFGLANNGVGYADNPGVQAIKADLDAIAKKVASGEIKVPETMKDAKTFADGLKK